LKHAGPDALDSLEPLLAEIRKLPGLTERTRGVFYRRGNAFLHFHEDPSGMFADLRTSAEFERLPVNSKREATQLIRRAAAALK